MNYEMRLTRNFKKIADNPHKFLVLRGGMRSGKTFAVMQHIFIWLISGKFRGQSIKEGYVSVVRKTFPALQSTAMRQFEKIISDNGMIRLIKTNKTYHIYEYEGRFVEFFSLDNNLKVHGKEREILFINECNEISFADFMQLAPRTTTGNIIIDLNPSNPYTWAKEEIEDKRAVMVGDVGIIVSTYKDNPELPKAQVHEIEMMREMSDSLWNVYGLGQWGEIKGAIFAHAKICDALPAYYKKRWYGMDFGFTNDPTVIVEVREGFDGSWYLEELAYEPTPDTRTLLGLVAACIPTKQVPIYSDTLPTVVKDLQQAGWPMYPCSKGANSVIDGITILQGKKLFITARSTNAIKEKNSYIWREVAGQVSNIPIDKFNHFWDAVRYVALETSHKVEKRRLFYS